MNILNKTGNRLVRFFSAFFLLVFLACMFSFAGAYRRLNLSIQSERIRSVQQLGMLISDKITMMKNSYSRETEQLASILMHSRIEDMEQFEKIFSQNGDIFLVTEEGTLLSANGDKLLIDDSDLRKNVLEGLGVKSSFATVQTKGDYWLFSTGIRDVTLGEQKIVGLVRMISAREYANIATISLYDGLGASYVVDREGLILMRPQTADANGVFNGYNFFRILEQEEVNADEINHLREAIRNETEYQFISNIRGTTWLIQNVPGDAERGIIITVPVSLTAKDTYGDMRMVILLIAAMIVTLASLVLCSLFLVMKRGQLVELNEAKTKAKNDFLDKMSHDIRTPLNAIIGMHELALSSLDQKEAVEDYLKKARLSSEYLVSIINDVLDMSKIENEKMTLSHRQFDVAELLNHVMEMETVPAREKGLLFSLDVRTTIDADFIGDPVRLRQCLVNLISNAIKFTPEGGEVTLIYEAVKTAEGETASFTVRDTGIGMSREFLDRIFMPFEQEASSLTSTYVGSGLGLSIVKSLAELMGGSITVDSTLGRGSTFILKIPFPTAEKAAEKENEKPEETFICQIRGRRVLFVEDNEINREIGITTLKSLGLIADTAENGRIAVDKLEKSPPGYYKLILMDIQMPVMNGLEAARHIRASSHPDGKTVPIVALSANAFEEDSRRSVEAGMQEHLAKPIDIAELKMVLRKYLS